MAHYRQVGEVPASGTPSSATPTGSLYREELMGEEGFSSDSSLLYHRGRAVGDRRRRGLGAARPDPDPQPPAQAAAPQAARARPTATPTPVTGRRLVLGNNDVRIGYVVTGVDAVAVLPQRDRRRVRLRRGRQRHRRDRLRRAAPTAPATTS